MSKEKIIQEAINRKSILIKELKELEREEKKVEKLKKQKKQELYQIEKQFPNLTNEEIKEEKRYFYCSICKGNCEGLKKGYFH